jgi:hypothetical protein
MSGVQTVSRATRTTREEPYRGCTEAAAVGLPQGVGIDEEGGPQRAGGQGEAAEGRGEPDAYLHGPDDSPDSGSPINPAPGSPVGQAEDEGGYPAQIRPQNMRAWVQSQSGREGALCPQIGCLPRWEP